jgi:hypothetical protein
MRRRTVATIVRVWPFIARTFAFATAVRIFAFRLIKRES